MSSPMCIAALVLGISLFPLAIASAQPVHDWSKRFGGTEGDRGMGVAVDASGNVLVTGSFQGTANFGGSNLTSAGSVDIFVAKYNGNGVHQWSKSFGNTLADGGVAIAADRWGSVLVTGSFRGTVNFGGADLTASGTINDGFVVKFDSDGAHEWSKRFGDTSFDAGIAIATDATGNVLVTGNFTGTIDFGGGNLTSAGFFDTFLVRFNKNGVHQWSQRFGGTGDDQGRALATNASNDVIWAGYFNETVDFGGGGLTSAGNADIFIARYDSNGVHQTSRHFGGTGTDNGLSVAVDAWGNMSLSGIFNNTVSFGGDSLTGAGSNDIFVARFTSDGVHRWSKRVGDTTFDAGTAVSVDMLGNVVVAGFFGGTVDFGGGALASNSSSRDIFVARYDSGGAHQWSQGFGGTGTDYGRAVVVDGAGDIVLTGSFEGVANFGGGNLISAGGDDFFLAKFDGEVSTPVFINAFRATPTANAVEITWSFFSDEALDRYTLYRRHEGSPAIVVASGDADFVRSYTDVSVESGKTYHYELIIRTTAGDEYRSPVATASISLPSHSLSQNYPNPFNPATTIEYTVDIRTTVSIDIFSSSGALVVRLNRGEHPPGNYRAQWNGRDATGIPVSSGVYFYRLAGLRGSETRKMILVK